MVCLFITNELWIYNSSTFTSQLQGPHPSLEPCSMNPSIYISFSIALLYLDSVQGIKKHAELFVLSSGTQVLRDTAKSTVVITMSPGRAVLSQHRRSNHTYSKWLSLRGVPTSQHLLHEFLVSCRLVAGFCTLKSFRDPERKQSLFQAEHVTSLKRNKYSPMQQTQNGS